MKKGFTLAEVLITLGIVGVVAVLTIPAVMKNYKNRLYTAQLEKAYAQVSDAVTAIMNDEHVDNFYETTAASAQSCTNANKGECTAGAGYFLNNYFKAVRKNCGTSSDIDDRCIAGTTDKQYQTIDGTNAGGVTSDYCVQTPSGSAFCMKRDTTTNPTYIYMCVDVNGTAEPNITGRDLFCMDIKSDGSITDYGSKSRDPDVAGADAEDCNTNASGFYGGGCLTAIIEAGWKMEY